MPDVTVHPHGTRWAVATSDASSPVNEFETRDAAVVAARDLAGGGRVEVLDDDPTGLEERGGARAGAEGHRDAEPIDGVTAPDHPRTEQGGL
jgi:hypothetical protein